VLQVCRASKQFLKLMEGKAVIRINDINPMLFSFVEELNQVKVVTFNVFLHICDLRMLYIYDHRLFHECGIKIYSLTKK